MALMAAKNSNFPELPSKYANALEQCEVARIIYVECLDMLRNPRLVYEIAVDMVEAGYEVDLNVDADEVRRAFDVFRARRRLGVCRHENFYY